MIAIQRFIDLCGNYCPNPNVMFEIGAREAADSVLFKSRFPSAEVYAFEAYDDEFKTHTGREYLKDINYINLGMWNENTKVTFHQKGVGLGISSIRDRGAQYGVDCKEIHVSRVDTFCQNNKIDSIDIAKIDVEGCSYEVLEGFGELIQSVKIMHVETEQIQHFENQKTESQVFELLERSGMKMLEHVWCCLRQYDSVWIR